MARRIAAKLVWQCRRRRAHICEGSDAPAHRRRLLRCRVVSRLASLRGVVIVAPACWAVPTLLHMWCGHCLWCWLTHCVHAQPHELLTQTRIHVMVASPPLHVCSFSNWYGIKQMSEFLCLLPRLPTSDRPIARSVQPTRPTRPPAGAARPPEHPTPPPARPVQGPHYQILYNTMQHILEYTNQYVKYAGSLSSAVPGLKPVPAQCLQRRPVGVHIFSHTSGLSAIGDP